MATGHYSPLRYPGGKGKLLPFVKELILCNGLGGGSYSEPYAGGANIALGLLVEDYVSEVYINDIDRAIYSFWHSVLKESEAFMRKIWDTPVTMEQWKLQKEIYKNQGSHNFLEVGFATFFLNRTNRSGVIKGGVIGGNNQQGNYKIDARYNKKELLKRINRIAFFADKIQLSQLDALEFLVFLEQQETKGLVFLDPPYYKKGHQLYTNFYKASDHIEIAAAIKKSPLKHWIVTYDNAPEINEIYDLSTKKVYNLRYSLSQTQPTGAEVLFYSNSLKLPACPII